MTDEADCSLVLALLQVAFVGKCDDYGLGPWGWPFSILPDLIADCHKSSGYILSTYLDQFCWNVVDSGQLPFLQSLYCGLHFFVRMGWSSSVSVWGQSSTDGSPLAL